MKVKGKGNKNHLANWFGGNRRQLMTYRYKYVQDLVILTLAVKVRFWFNSCFSSPENFKLLCPAKILST